jgi:hypothetical protein
MKKYWLAFAAVVLGFALSAFTVTDDKYDSSYYWYAINGTNLGARLGDVNGSPVQYTQGQAMTAGLTSCNDVGSVSCIAGHAQSDQSGQPLPSDLGDNFVKRTNP